MGGNPRVVGSLAELVTVEIAAEDTECPTDELAQYRAARKLFDLWFAAVRRRAYGAIEWRSAKWVVNRKNNTRGAVLQIVLSVSAAIPDDEQTQRLTTPARAEIESTLLDHTETLTAPDPS